MLSSPPQPPPPPAPVDNRPRLRLVEKKRKISIQDDIYPRKQCKIYYSTKLMVSMVKHFKCIIVESVNLNVLISETT